MINVTKNIKNIFIEFLKSKIATKKLEEKKKAFIFIFDQYKVLEILQNYIVSVSLSDIYFEINKKDVSKKVNSNTTVQKTLKDKLNKLNKTIRKIKTFMLKSTNPNNPQNIDILSRVIIFILNVYRNLLIYFAHVY